MKAKCRKCGDTIEVTKLKDYKTCKCGAIALDYGDEYYYRVCGAPEDFDGEVKGIPRIKDIERISDIDSMEPGSTITIDGHKMTVKKCVNKNRDGLASISHPQDDATGTVVRYAGVTYHEPTEEDYIKTRSADDSMGKAAEVCDYLSKAIRVKESFMDVNVYLCEDGALYIEDAETDEQLAAFHIKEEK